MATEINPYAPPNSPHDESIYYRALLKNLTFAEIWRITKPNLLVTAICLFSKILRTSGRPQFGLALRNPTLSDIEQLSASDAKQLASLFQQLKRLGFSPQFIASTPSIGNLHGRSIIWSNFHSPIWASVMISTVTVRGRAKTENGVVFCSTFASDHFLFTANIPKRLDGLPEIAAFHFPKAPCDDLLRRHEELLELQPEKPLRMEQGELRQTVLRIMQLGHEFQIQRKLYVPMDQAQILSLQSFPAQKSD